MKKQAKYTDTMLMELGLKSNKDKIPSLVYLFYNFFCSMARFVRKEDKGPMEVKVGNESRWICMCGLRAYPKNGR